MDSSTIVRIVLIAIGVWLAIKIVFWLLGVVMNLLNMAIIVAVIIGIVYLLYALFGKQKRAY